MLLAVALPLAPARADDLLGESFEAENWWKGWVDYRHSDQGGTDDERGKIVAAGFRGKGLGVTIPPYGRRGSGAHYLFPDGLQEGWFRYHMVLDKWNAADSGKLPGFADVGATTAKGCKPSTPTDPGWSARVMFNPPGTVGAPVNQIRLGYYTYHLDQPKECGEKMPWSDDAIIRQGRWYCVEGHVKVNTPGANDGVLEAWVDGRKVFTRDDLNFRRPGEQSRVQLRSLWLDIYFGGSTVVNNTNLAMRIDQLVVRNDRRAGCAVKFTDTVGNIHQSNVEFLHSLGLVFGCAQNLYCPKDDVTRAEMLALIDRYLKPPATDRDFFTDDAGHWAEDVINRLAAAGIVKGCTATEVCPNRPLSRGEIAAFLTRTFRLPVPEENYFKDAGDVVFTNDINAIAAAGFTKGCNADEYCPENLTRRDELASLYARAVQWAEPLEQ